MNDACLQDCSAFIDQFSRRAHPGVMDSGQVNRALCCWRKKHADNIYRWTPMRRLLRWRRYARRRAIEMRQPECFGTRLTARRRQTVLPHQCPLPRHAGDA